MNSEQIEQKWILCPVCGSKTRVKLFQDTELRNFPLFCPKCKHESRINATHFSVETICFKGLDEKGTVEIGYGIDQKYEGRGLTTEAVIALTKWASEQPGVLHIEAETDPDNIASQKVLKKAGFLPNGIMGEEGPRFELKNC